MFECKRFVSNSFLEVRWSGFDTGFDLAKEQLVGTVNAFGNILNRLTTKLVPRCIFIEFLELCQMFLVSWPINVCQIVDSIAGGGQCSDYRQNCIVQSGREDGGFVYGYRV